MGSSLIESAPPAIDPIYRTDSVHHIEKDKKIYIFRPPSKGEEEKIIKVYIDLLVNVFFTIVYIW